MSVAPGMSQPNEGHRGFSGYGSNYTSVQWNIDLTIGIEVLNLFNEDAVENFASWQLYPGDDFVPSNWINPRRAQLRVKFAF